MRSPSIESMFGNKTCLARCSHRADALHTKSYLCLLTLQTFFQRCPWVFSNRDNVRSATCGHGRRCISIFKLILPIRVNLFLSILILWTLICNKINRDAHGRTELVGRRDMHHRLRHNTMALQLSPPRAE